MKVNDFAVARAEGRSTQTLPGIIKGRLGYLSPEQIRGRAVDRRTDAFALGVCLYDLLTGQRFFDGEELDALQRAATAQVPPPSTYDRELPQALERIVLRALAPDVNERHPSTAALAADLQPFPAGADADANARDLRQYLRDAFGNDLQREARRGWRERGAGAAHRCGAVARCAGAFSPSVIRAVFFTIVPASASTSPGFKLSFWYASRRDSPSSSFRPCNFSKAA